MPDGIIIHHSATRDSATVSWDAIRRHHTQVNGWSDIGYHFGIELVGESYRILGGRPVHLPGAHCVGHNLCLGICLIGDFDQATPPPEQLRLLNDLVLGLLLAYRLAPKDVFFHGELAKTACPGRNFPRREFLAKLKSAWGRIGGGHHGDD